MSDADDDGLDLFDDRIGISPDAPDVPDRPAPHSALPPDAVVRLDFPRAGTHLDVPVGGELRLGRDSSWAPQASCLLTGEATVSGQHAVVTCADDGTLTVTEAPRGSRNGVRVGSHVLSPGSTEPLHRGDTVWLGPRVSFTVQDPMGVLAP